MKSELDSQNIEIPCPNCGHKLSERIGKIKTNPTVICSACSVPFAVDATAFTREFQKVEKALADLKRTLGRLGK